MTSLIATQPRPNVRKLDSFESAMTEYKESISPYRNLLWGVVIGAGTGFWLVVAWVALNW